MKNLIVKPASLVLLFLCLFITLEMNANNDVPTSVMFSNCGTIVVEGDIMLTETEEPSASIEVIILENVSNGQTYTFTGCGANTCSTSISRLPLGFYEATVVTSDCTFTKTVEKK